MSYAVAVARPAGLAECTVWIAHVPLSSDHLVSLLDASEALRRTQYERAADRHRFTAAAALLRILAGELSATAPRRVQIDRTCTDCGRPHGKPRLVDRPDLDVSISHSGDWVAVAAARGARVGVDVEADPADWHELAAAACTPHERAAIHGAHEFALTWVRKEAALKALGVGLRIDPASVEVTPAGTPAGLIAIVGAEVPAAVLADLEVGPTHAGAVAVLGVPAGALTIRVESADHRLTTG